MSGVRALVKNVRLYEPTYVLPLYLDYVLRGGLHATFLRRMLTPALQDFFDAGMVYTSGADLIREQLHCDGTALHAIFDEHNKLLTRVRARVEARSLPYLEAWALCDASSLLVYALVRLARPTTVLETGVANGASTYFILQALERNGHGQLHSLDVAEDVGALVDPAERARWHLQVLKTRRIEADFRAAVNALPPIDLFLHDSDHRYAWQRFEYETVLGHLAPGGTIATDDADASFGFLDFCRDAGRAPVVALDVRKVFGFVSPDQRPVAAAP